MVMIRTGENFAWGGRARVKMSTFDFLTGKWGKVFKNGPSKICGRQPLKYLKRYGLPRQTVSLQIFKCCLPQILLGLFLNTLPIMHSPVKYMPPCLRKIFKFMLFNTIKLKTFRKHGEIYKLEWKLNKSSRKR